MKQVDFYLIANRVNHANYKLASRLANKLQRLNSRALVITDSEQDSAQLDQMMWAFSDTSFLAHDLLSQVDASSDEPSSSIHIGEQANMTNYNLEKQYDVLINISSQVPDTHHFARIAEIVEQDDDAKAAARLRYKHYQEQGVELKTHQIEL